MCFLFVCGKILRGRKDTLAGVVSTLRGRAPAVPTPLNVCDCDRFCQWLSESRPRPSSLLRLPRSKSRPRRASSLRRSADDDASEQGASRGRPCRPHSRSSTPPSSSSLGNEPTAHRAESGSREDPGLHWIASGSHVIGSDTRSGSREVEADPGLQRSGNGSGGIGNDPGKHRTESREVGTDNDVRRGGNGSRGIGAYPGVHRGGSRDPGVQRTGNGNDRGVHVAEIDGHVIQYDPTLQRCRSGSREASTCSSATTATSTSSACSLAVTGTGSTGHGVTSARSGSDVGTSDFFEKSASPCDSGVRDACSSLISTWPIIANGNSAAYRVNVRACRQFSVLTLRNERLDVE